MKIGNSSIETVKGDGVAPVKGADGRASSIDNGVNADSVTLSSAGNLVALAKASASSTYQAKVQNLAAQVRAGQYQTDTTQISHSVVEGHLDGK